MLRHIVMIKIKEEVDIQSVSDKLVVMLNALEDSIPTY
jgi:hypothetical protein